jgi:heme a synthase
MDSQARAALPPEAVTGDAQLRFTRYAWWLLGYALFVILFGAVVRITGSGAGCGQHWPTCNGQLLHLPQTLKTTIEYTHRATSALSVLGIVGLLGAAFRLYPSGHQVRASACLAFTMILVEAAIGAVLVKLRLVENDASLGRILVLPLHLTSTALLTAALAWCACFARLDPRREQPLPIAARTLIAVAGLGILLVSATGAVTALGDTVYPVQTSGFAARLAEDQGLHAALLQRIRGIHPFLAVGVAAFVAYAAALLPGYRSSTAVKRASGALYLSVCLQVLVGVLNVWLSAPGPIQVLHLLLANFTWISLIVLAASARQAGQLAPSQR